MKTIIYTLIVLYTCYSSFASQGVMHKMSHLSTHIGVTEINEQYVAFLYNSYHFNIYDKSTGSLAQSFYSYAGEYELIGVSNDHLVFTDANRLLNIESGEIENDYFPVEGNISSLQLLGSSKEVVCFIDDYTSIVGYNIKTKEKIFSYSFKDSISDFFIHEDNSKTISVVTLNGSLKIYDIKSDKLYERCINVSGDMPLHIVFSEDGLTLLIKYNYRDNELGKYRTVIIDAKTGDVVETIYDYSPLKFNSFPSNDSYVYQNENNVVVIRNYQSKKVESKIDFGPYWIGYLSFTGQSQVFVAGEASRSNYLYNYTSKTVEKSYDILCTHVYAIEFSKSGDYFATLEVMPESARYENVLRVFDTSTMTQINGFVFPTQELYKDASLLWEGDTYVFLATKDGDRHNVWKYDFKQKKVVKKYVSLDSSITAMHLTSDDRYLTYGSKAGDLVLYDLYTDKTLVQTQAKRIIDAEDLQVSSIAFDLNTGTICFRTLNYMRKYFIHEDRFDENHKYNGGQDTYISQNARYMYSLAPSNLNIFDLYDYGGNVYKWEYILISEWYDRSQYRLDLLFKVSDNGNLLVGVTYDDVLIFDLKHEKLIGVVDNLPRFNELSYAINCISISNDNKYVIVGSRFGSVSRIEIDKLSSVKDSYETIHLQNQLKTHFSLADKQLTIFDLNRNKQYSFQIFDVNGKILYNGTFDTYSNTDIKLNNINTIGKSMYFISVHSKDNSYFGKIIGE